MVRRMPDAVCVASTIAFRSASYGVSSLTTAVSIRGIRPCSRVYPTANTAGLRCLSICITACRTAVFYGPMRSHDSITARLT